MNVDQFRSKAATALVTGNQAPEADVVAHDVEHGKNYRVIDVEFDVEAGRLVITFDSSEPIK